MQFAAHYSPQAADLLKAGQIQADRFKCPAWPDLIEAVLRIHPVYVHFPLIVGAGTGDALDGETRQSPDWHKFETLLAQTDTPFLNVHLSIAQSDYPNAADDPLFGEKLIENTIRDLEAVIRRFGAERVIAENDHDNGGKHVPHILQPAFIRHVIEAAGCGLLLDVSHARLAAMHLGVDVKEYLQRLPLDRVREIHVTGIQTYDQLWMTKIEQAGIKPDPLARYAGRPLDHLPMTEPDWVFFEWVLEQIRGKQWATPWIIAFEYGGVGGVWQALTDQVILREQIPRLYQMVHLATR